MPYTLKIIDTVNAEKNSEKDFDMGIKLVNELVAVYGEELVEQHISSVFRAFSFHGQSHIQFSVPSYGIIKASILRK